MDNFKNTDIGLLPEHWNLIPLENEEYFKTINGLWKGKKPPFKVVTVIRNTNFTEFGIVDYSDVAVLDVEEKQYQSRKLFFGDVIIERSGGGPTQPVGRVVFFDRSTGEYSFSNFTSCLRTLNQNEFLPKYVFYSLLHFYLSGRTDSLQARTTGIRNLNFTSYKEKAGIPKISLPEQKKIAHVLSKIQQAIETQEQIIKTTQELKKALMQKLFTEGLNGEPQKQTEIGPIPKSWEVIELGKLFKLSSGKGRPKDISELPDNLKTIPIFGGNGILGYTELKMLDMPVLVIGRVGEYCGVTYVTKGVSWISDNALYTKKVLREFNINYMKEFLTYFDLNRFRNRGGQPLVTQGIIHEIKVGLPHIKEQNLMSEYLESLNSKIDQEKTLLQYNKDLFRSSLNQLMSGQIRVKDIELKLVG
ncbi:MAG: restriction endonuclease subunit S [Ignavibacterium sp.]|nr:restriction endonuclease subunit S [Ignavibacterium sp.]